MILLSQQLFKNVKASSKKCAPFTKCITKIDGATIDDAEYLDLVMPMCSLIEYGSNYSETTVSLGFYSKDETNDFNADIANTDNFKGKAKSLGNTIAQPNPNHANGGLKNATLAVPLKYLSNLSNLNNGDHLKCH